MTGEFVGRVPRRLSKIFIKVPFLQVTLHTLMHCCPSLFTFRCFVLSSFHTSSQKIKCKSLYFFSKFFLNTNWELKKFSPSLPKWGAAAHFCFSSVFLFFINLLSLFWKTKPSTPQTVWTKFDWFLRSMCSEHRELYIIWTEFILCVGQNQHIRLNSIQI